MILRGDGHSNIVEFNSLDQQTYTLKRLVIRGVKESNPLPGIALMFPRVVRTNPVGLRLRSYSDRKCAMCGANNDLHIARL